MDFRYIIPQHLEPYLSDMDDKALNKLTTMLFEIAVNHRLLDYPKLYIEKQVDDMVTAMSLVLSQNDKMLRIVTEELTRMNSKLDKATLSVTTPNSYISTDKRLDYGNVEDADEEEDYFKEVAKKTETEDQNSGDGDDDLSDELLA